MGQTKPAAGLKSLNRAADTLSTLLAQEVKELNERQKAARRESTPQSGKYFLSSASLFSVSFSTRSLFCGGKKPLTAASSG